MAEKLEKLEKSGYGGKREGSGRKKSIEKLRKLLAKQNLEITTAEFWLKIAKDAAVPRILHILQEGSDDRSAVTAAQEVLNRLLGKPTEKHELSGRDGSPIQFVLFGNEDPLRLVAGSTSVTSDSQSSKIQSDSVASEGAQDNTSDQPAA